MNLLCQLLCFGSLLVSPDEKNHLLILEQIITQLATNRQALKIDRNAINKLLYDNDRLTSDVLNLENKILDLEKELKRYFIPPPTEEEVTAALIDKLANKLVKFLIRECGKTQSLTLMTVFLNDDKNPNTKQQQMAFDASVRAKLLKHREFNTQEAFRLDKLARGSKEIVLENFKTNVLIFLVIEEDIQDSCLDMWFQESPDNDNVVVPPVQKLKQTPAQGPALAPAPAQAPASYRFFKR